MSASSSNKILLQVSGSVAAFKAVALASLLKKVGFEVKTVLTEGAREFVGPASFEGITGNPVYLNPFETGSMMAHIELERWADLILLYPASAESISVLAEGSGRSLVGQIFLAHEFQKPYLVAPAMNQAMWKHPALRANLDRIRSFGLQILEPASGLLACGESGEGRLMEPEQALQAIQKQLAIHETKQPERGPRVLVTAGGTTEPIDEVRHLANLSTGRTGHEVARALQESGCEVTLLQSEYSFARDGIQNLKLFSTTRDFAEKVRDELMLHDYDFVIHSAAVADYHVESVADDAGKSLPLNGKIQGSGALTLTLKLNPKVIRELRTWSRNKNLKIISFKLTADEATDAKLDTYDSEWIIQNHLKDVGPVKHCGTVYERVQGKYEAQASFKTKEELKSLIAGIVQGRTPAERTPS
ncbi:MAG: bifunctional phosphopantothenoylcysteine decarboxylase/phosphopantothenate--cysteine ligase CoaBC [Proteobacteria bacterium]|nr:bifunctional phosphopantothenoylcysteine decarboxylase/phosphopantothenate--cysteine ligase CoaBC [Pseudomonadota bacterium]